MESSTVAVGLQAALGLLSCLTRRRRVKPRGEPVALMKRRRRVLPDWVTSRGMHLPLTSSVEFGAPGG